MTDQARTIRRCLASASVFLLIGCATTQRVAVREWSKGEFVYELDEPPIRLGLSREHFSQLSEAERFLTDFYERLKPHVPSLDAGGYLPATCDVWILTFSEPQVSCIGSRRGPMTAPPPVAVLEQAVFGAFPPLLPSVGPSGHRKLTVWLQSQQAH
jgi:hypothetical protein